MRVKKKLVRIQQVIDALEDYGFEVEMMYGPANTAMMAWSEKLFETDPVEGRMIPVFTGIAECSDEDNFDKATGTTIAFRRMISAMSDYVGRDGMKQILGA